MVVSEILSDIYLWIMEPDTLKPLSFLFYKQYIDIKYQWNN